MNSMDAMKVGIKAELLKLARNEPDRKDECQTTLGFLETVDNGFTRKNLSGHFTASGWVVDKTLSKALLIHHRILDIWIHPGGHMETGETPIETAAREVFEETGIRCKHRKGSGLFDIGVHSIPPHERKAEPEHWHYVLTFLMMAENEALDYDEGEVEDAKWIELDMIVNVPEKFEESVVRMAMRTLEIFDEEDASKTQE